MTAFTENCVPVVERTCDNCGQPEALWPQIFKGGRSCCDICEKSLKAYDEDRAAGLHELSEGGTTVGLTKHGSGDVLREPEDNVKVAKTAWSEADAKALAKENEDADDDAE